MPAGPDVMVTDVGYHPLSLGLGPCFAHQVLKCPLVECCVFPYPENGREELLLMGCCWFFFSSRVDCRRGIWEQLILTLLPLMAEQLP